MKVSKTKNLTSNQMLLLSVCCKPSPIPLMLERIETHTGVKISPAGAYTTVDRLEHEGLVKCDIRDQTNPSGRIVKRRYVKITKAGQKTLAEYHRVMKILSGWTL